MKNISSVLIATFSPWNNGKRGPTNGMVEPLISFFVPKNSQVTLIDQPYPGSDRIFPMVEIYKKGKLIKKTNSFVCTMLLYPILFLQNTSATRISFKLRDFFSILEWVILTRKHYDLFIGLESINTLAGIFLRKLGFISTVIYYVSDYSPIRYSSPLLNKIYLWLDRLCAKHADFIWDVSKTMMPARIKAGLSKSKAAPVIHVPNAIFPSQIRVVAASKLVPYSLAFAGTTGPENGLDLAIEALAIARKKIPQLTLHIVGGGRKEDDIRITTLIEQLHLTKNIRNHGFINNLSKLSDVLSMFMVGLAPYRAIPNSVRWYADATKMRLYFANGLPVITTQVPPLGKEAKEKGCAVVVNDTKEGLAKAIIDILADEKRYQTYRKAAILFAKNNTWENTYQSAVDQMGMVI